MALTASLSQKELERVAQLAYEGYAVRVSLANDAGATLDAEDTVAAWDALKVSGSGYADFRSTIGTGTYDVGDQRYELPTFDAEFTATTTGYIFTNIYTVLGTYNTFDIDTAALTSNVATITTTAAHGFSVSDLVLISGATDTDYNGYHVIATTPTTTSFTFSLASADKASASSDGTAATITEETHPHSVLTETPAINLAAGQVQTYRVLIATDD
jgi:hypothetical protein